jgi:RING finger protein 113A
MASTESVPVPFFKKKRARPTTTRQRTPSPPAASSTAPSASSSKSQVVLPSRRAGGNLLSAGTKRTSSQRRTDDLDEEEIDEGTRDGPGINWTSTGGHVNKALEILAGDEAEEMQAKRARKDDPAEEDDVPDDGLYHGQKSYKSHIKKNQEIPKTMRSGPVRSNNSTIRTVTIVDYQPDVCKDYKGASPFSLPRRTLLTQTSLFQKPVFVALETRANSCTTEEPVRHMCSVVRGLMADPFDDRPRRMATR